MPNFVLLHLQAYIAHRSQTLVASLCLVVQQQQLPMYVVTTPEDFVRWDTTAGFYMDCHRKKDLQLVATFRRVSASLGKSACSHMLQYQKCHPRASQLNLQRSLAALPLIQLLNQLHRTKQRKAARLQ
mmetsp:Transcript_9863/g.18795  ORF Transcript_9863/g.18795 Transcript_9863/m.18795 type:complete len:128 (+) Transcript_9863:573-956(+)